MTSKLQAYVAGLPIEVRSLKILLSIECQFEDSDPGTYLEIACVYCFRNQNHAQHGQGILHLLRGFSDPPPLIFVIIFFTECNQKLPLYILYMYKELYNYPANFEYNVCVHLPICA